jgi:NADH dehydrogenase (ubiquinone) 1 alpha subcomplex subunit 9
VRETRRRGKRDGEREREKKTRRARWNDEASTRAPLSLSPTLPRPRSPQYAGLTATVFGGTGFLGRYLVAELARSGARVILPHRRDEIDTQHLKVMGDLGQVVQVPGFSLRDEAAIERAVAKSAVVFNLIGADGPTKRWPYEEVHVAGAARLAAAAAAAPAVERFVQVSVLGASPTAPSPRLRSRAAGEAAVRAAFPGATTARAAPLVGVEDRLTNALAGLGVALPAIPLVGGGRAALAPAWVVDVAAALVASLRSPTAPGRTFELAGPDTLTVAGLADLVLDLMREPRRTVPVPAAAAALAARLPFAGSLLPPAFLTADAVAEASVDRVASGAPGVGGFADLGVSPSGMLAGGAPVDHLRWLRAGGYEVGTTSGNASTGGAGFGAPVA